MARAAKGGASKVEMRSKPRLPRFSYTHTFTLYACEHAAISMPPPQPERAILAA